MAIFISLVLAVSQPESDPACALIRPVAPDAATARRIAEAVIANVPPSVRASAAMARGTRYTLHVLPDLDEPAAFWLAYQAPPRARQPRSGRTIILQAAGHGLGFRIDRCTGAISRMAYMR